VREKLRRKRHGKEMSFQPRMEDRLTAGLVAYQKMRTETRLYDATD